MGTIEYKGRQIADPRRVKALDAQVAASQAQDPRATANGATVRQWQAAQAREEPTPYDAELYARSVQPPVPAIGAVTGPTQSAIGTNVAGVENPWADEIHRAAMPVPGDPGHTVDVSPIRQNAPGQMSMGDWMRMKDAQAGVDGTEPEWLQQYMRDAPKPEAQSEETLATTKDPYAYMTQLGIVKDGKPGAQGKTVFGGEPDPEKARAELQARGDAQKATWQQKLADWSKSNAAARMFNPDFRGDK